DCTRLRNLEDLDLQYNVGGDEDLLTLAASPYLTNLRTYCFDFADDVQGSLEPLKALGRSPIMRNAIILNPWMGCPDGDESVRVMSESPPFANVRHSDPRVQQRHPRRPGGAGGFAILAQRHPSRPRRQPTRRRRRGAGRAAVRRRVARTRPGRQRSD